MTSDQRAELAATLCALAAIASAVLVGHLGVIAGIWAVQCLAGYAGFLLLRTHLEIEDMVTKAVDSTTREDVR